jgi:hypothetical protein
LRSCLGRSIEHNGCFEFLRSKISFITDQIYTFESYTSAYVVLFPAIFIYKLIALMIDTVMTIFWVMVLVIGFGVLFMVVDSIVYNLLRSGKSLPGAATNRQR